MQASGVTKSTVKTKSRTGCQACKSKRLKCGEERPGCLQCSRRQKQCPGYQKILKWSTKYEKAVAKDTSLAEDAVIALRDSIASSLATVPGKVQKDESMNEMPKLNARNADGIDVEQNGLMRLPEQKRRRSEFKSSDEHVPEDGISLDQNSEALEIPGLTDGLIDPALDMALEVEELMNGQHQWLEASVPGEQNEDVINLAMVRHSTHSPATLSRQLIDQSTFLVEYWFSEVCPMWSAFDSDKNPNRVMASSTWSSSEPVFHSLNYMAATCLSDTLPRLKRSVPGLAMQAIESIKRSVCQPISPDMPLPMDVLLAMFAVGTSLAWTDTRQLGCWLLKDARALVTEYEMRSANLDQKSRQQLSHFRTALVYWEMLVRAVSDDIALPDEHDNVVEYLAEPLELVSESSHASSTPHPWTGVSTRAYDLFSLVMMLCRKSRTRSQKCQMMSARALRGALADIEEAQIIARELRQLESQYRDGQSVHGMAQTTNDDRTPIQHLIDAGEAYRLAGLLQLYLAFPNDLPPATLHIDTVPRQGDGANHVVELALRLVNTLERIPATSGTRSILPMAIISAAAGLKYIETSTASADPDSPVVEDWLNIESLLDDITPEATRQEGPPAFQGNSSNLEFGMPSSMMAMPFSQPHFSTSVHDNPLDTLFPTLTALHLRIATARRSVLARLNALHGSLPRRPIAIAIKLVKAIWADYDSSESGQENHWIDTMFRTGLWTLFG